jgi:hypothetical protein
MKMLISLNAYEAMNAELCTLNPLTPFDYLKAKQISGAKTAQK